MEPGGDDHAVRLVVKPAHAGARLRPWTSPAIPLLRSAGYLQPMACRGGWGGGLGRREVLSLVGPLLGSVVVGAGCGDRPYTEKHCAMAVEYINALLERADEPLRGELAQHKAGFDARMANLPTDPEARSAAIRVIFDDVTRIRSDYEKRILEDLTAKARTALTAGGYVGLWSTNTYKLSIRADGVLHGDRSGESPGPVLRVDQGGLRLRVSRYPRADTLIVLDFAPRTVGEHRQIGVHGYVLTWRS